jgi:hypothetical protein
MGNLPPKLYLNPVQRKANAFFLASTAEGGKGASIMCVPDWLNGFYGYIWNTFRSEQVRTNGFTKGSKFRIIVEGCDLKSLKKSRTKRVNNRLVLNSHNNCKLQ